MAPGFHHLARHLPAFRSVRVLCVGDVMLDRYVYGRVSRISAEAPVPIMTHRAERLTLGAVGNVARNVAALGGHAIIVAIVGEDEGGREIARMIAEEDSLEAALVTVPGRRTTLKTRYIAQGQQLLRADQEDTHPLDDQARERLIAAVSSAVGEADVVLLSDYAKGCLGDEVLRAVIGAAREAGKPVIADPKGTKLARYDGATLVKPNAGELESITGVGCADNQSAAYSAQRALELADIDALLVTRSEHGMTLAERGKDPVHFSEKGSEVFDVSGAGDTALAVVGLAVGAGASLPEATQLANKTCKIVVSKVGTAVVYESELAQALQSADVESAGAKIHPLAVVVDKATRWRAQGATVGFTNGCFDLIHAGHVSLLTQAKENCDRLIVGLNTDGSVRRLKGDGRPVNNETARAVVLASLGAVDAVVLFPEETPKRLIEAIRPDVLIKGADYTESEIVGADFIQSYGGRVFLADLAPESSTTSTIRRIKG
jgi:D-beta-D-heptose 7-phosphate kinase/D-beta-D-heptose 1-phosphate adenosyltransferase